MTCDDGVKRTRWTVTSLIGLCTICSVHSRAAQRKVQLLRPTCTGRCGPQAVQAPAGFHCSAASRGGRFPSIGESIQRTIPVRSQPRLGASAGHAEGSGAAPFRLPVDRTQKYPAIPAGCLPLCLCFPLYSALRQHLTAIYRPQRLSLIRLSPFRYTFGGGFAGTSAFPTLRHSH